MSRHKSVIRISARVRRDPPSKPDLDFLPDVVIEASPGITHVTAKLPAHVRSNYNRPDALIAVITRPGFVPLTATPEEIATRYSQSQGVGYGLEPIPQPDPLQGEDVFEADFRVGVNTTGLFRESEVDIDADIFVIARYPE